MIEEFGGKSEYIGKTPPIFPYDPDDDEGEYIKGSDYLKPSQWLRTKNDILMAAASTMKIMPSGVYTIVWDNRTDQAVFKTTEIKIDNLIFEDNDISEKVINEVNIFWEKEKQYKNVGILHRRGFLLYGAQGTGKTSIVYQIIQDLIKQNGIVFICERPKDFSEGLQLFRKIEPKRKIVCLFEDIDATIKNYGEQEILSILDGENQIDYVFNLATTNYPEVLDKRIVARPRRFDRVIKVLPPSYNARLAYFKSKLKTKDNPEKWAEKTDNMSFAALAELIIAVKCLNESFEDSLERLQNMKAYDALEDDGEGLGFSEGKD